MENLDVARVEECTRLLLVSRHRLVREVLALRIETSGSFVVAALEDDLARGIAEARRRAADLLLIDASCLEDGALRLLAETGHDLKTVVLGLRGTASEVRRFHEAGIDGLVYRDTSLDELTRTLASVAEGERVCGARCTRDLFSRLERLGNRGWRGQEMGALDLTPRQMEVLRLIARGLGNERIADRLRLSPHTIKNHVHNILERLDAKDRAEAVAHAYQRRWLA
jgi:DNA-binding NarL/FixJ family response regulator